MKEDLLNVVEKLPLCPFSIKDRVTSKLLGYPFTGTLISITPTFLLAGPAPMNLPLWHEFYPDWESKYVCVVIFDQPQKNITFDEMLKLNKSSMSIELLKEVYSKLPEVSDSFYPMDDLELL